MEEENQYRPQAHIVIVGAWGGCADIARIERAAIRVPGDYVIHHAQSHDDVGVIVGIAEASSPGSILCLLSDARSDGEAAELAARLCRLNNLLVLSFSQAGSSSLTKSFVACFPFRPRMLPLVMDYLGILRRNALCQEGHIALDSNDVKALLGGPGAARLIAAAGTSHELLPDVVARRLGVGRSPHPSCLHVHMTSDRSLMGRTLKQLMSRIRSLSHPDSSFAMSLEYEEKVGLRVVVALQEPHRGKSVFEGAVHARADEMTGNWGALHRD